MFNNKAKLFLLFTVMFIAVIGISCVSATDVNDTDTITQHVTTADVPTTSNDDIDNTINNNVQSTSNINSNVNDNANEIKKTVEKQDKNLKELKSNDFSLSLDYAREIPAGSNLSVTYSIGLYETTFAELTLAVAYTNSNGKTVYIRNVYKNSEEESFPNGITDTVNFQNITPVDGAKSYFIHLSFQDMGTGSVETEANEYPFTFNNALPIPPNATVDSINFTTINDKVFVGVDTNVTVVLSNNGAECNRANVILNIDGVNQTKTITNLGSTPKSLVYNYTFANEGVKNVNIIVDYLNGTTSTVYTGTVTVTAPSEEDKSNVTLNSISYTKKQNKVITETTTNVTLTLGNTGNLACNEANVTLTIGDESQTKTITNLAPASTQNLIYNYYFKVPGTKTVSVVVDYLNGTTVEVYNGNVKVEIYYTTVSSEVLTTKASGTVTGGLYHNAIQNPSFDSSLYRKYQSDVTFNFADDYSNITTARLYAVLYDSRDEHPTYSINLTMDGNNDGEYETTIENNHYIGLATTPDSTVYKINDNITKVYTDYVLFYDVTDLINSNTVNVELNSSFGSIKCIGLIVAYNQENTGKEIDYWINLGTVWTNTDVSTTFATRNHDADDVELIQSISSSSNPTTTFNGNTLTYTKSPSGYFGIESWNVTDKYSSSSNMVLKNTASGSFKTMAATLALTSSLPENVVVDSVSFTKTQNAVLAYNDTNVTVVVRNDGVLCDEADVTLMIGDESQTKTVTNIGSAPQSVVFEEFFTSAGLKNVSVVITYSNGTTTTTYSGNVDVIASGYMGKFFTNNTNMTNKVTYDGYNTLNVYGNLFDYKSNQAISFTFDAVANGLTDQDKIVDIFYYQPWGVWNGQVANITVSLNGEELSYMSSYKDQKGFGGYDFPYGLYVYNITDKVSLDETNSFNIAPVSGAAGYAYFYGGYIVAVYENSTSRTLISIAEDCDALSAGTSSSYGATPDTAIAYANFNGIDTQDVGNAYVTVMANNANNQEYLYVNDNQKALLRDSYNYDSQVAIATVNVTDDITSNNTVAVKCVQDTSVYVLTSILVVTYEEPVQEPNVVVDSVSFTKTQNTVLAYNDTNVTVVVSNDGGVCDEAEITITIDGESQTKTVSDLDSTPQNLVFDYYFTTAGSKDVSVVVDYLNGTTFTAYTGSVDVVASGYMGKFFTNNTNMTNKVTYDGYNTLNVYGNLFDYKSNQAISFTFDAVANGLTDQDKIVDIFYYQPWGVWNGQVANITVSLNGEELSYMSSYKDQKGFGGYDFPYGLYVYNITDKVSLDETNSFNIAPVSGAAGYAYFYGGYIVAVYENSTSRTLISIAEDCDALSAGTSSSYGATPETAISYANFDGIDTTDVSNAYVTVMANNANTQEYLYMNDNQKALLKDSYNYGSQVAIATADVTEDIAADNVVAIKCVQDTSVYVLTSILVVTYEEPIKQIDMTVVSDCVTKADMATITITFNDTISDGKVEVFIGDEEVPITTITEFDSNVITIENIDTSNYNIGENTITVKYSESNKYEDLTRNAILTLTSRQVSLTAEPLVITKDVNAVNLTITFNDTLSDGIIKIYANNKEIANYNIEDNCNYVDVTINNLKLPLGENDIQIDYSNSQLYENSIINSTITISKLNTVITVDPTKLNTNKSVNLTARINGVNSDAIINEGKVVFKLNGKTLKDENGKVIYVKVVNGVASMIYSLDNISNYNNLNITATYSGSTTFDSSKSDAVTIEKPEVTSPIITMDNMTAKVKDKITINATIKDLEGNNLQNGKVVFKIDGKTVKDSEGKVIYADIINGEVSIEYDTSKLKVGNHTIKVVMISSLFDSRIDQTATLTIEG
ncbi:MAG: DUF3344 domain-containing protein [Methanosphaera stadtmanae]|nr:DUF3344 domain-containing protein [Methanosphaera stadtmanae]